jgi:TatA/E family protein of Tat protein translocase
MCAVMNTLLQPAFIEGIGGGELLLVLVVALMLFGSKNLPDIFRTMGRTSEQMRKAVREVKDEIMRVDVDSPPPPTPLPTIKPAAHLQTGAEPDKEKPDEPVAG